MKLKHKKQLLEKLKGMTDIRKHSYKIVYPLHEVVFMTLFAMIRGNVIYDDIVNWMLYQKNDKYLKKLFNYKKDEYIPIPSRATLQRLLVNVLNDELEMIFRDFFTPFIDEKNVAIDGKWLNGSDINGQYVQEQHQAVLNILCKDTKIVFGHVLLNKDKKSEIPAFTDLLEEEFFSKKGQILSFDALTTQIPILNRINEQGNFYIAKVKGNQLNLKKDVISKINEFANPTDTYIADSIGIAENNKCVKRTTQIYQNIGADLVLFHNNFKNIQSLIKVTKEITNLKTKIVTTNTQYLIANFKTTAQEFHNKILQHWAIETYHYHLDMLTKEDDHIAYKNPFCMSILRSFTINLYQLFLNKYKGQTYILPAYKTTMANIKRACVHDAQFAFDLFEMKY
jgi:predicted transposase YbfD/YdcC